MAKQQTYDATKMGPLSWRQLQLANQNYYANLEPGDELRAIMEANTVKAIPNSGSPELNWEGRVQSPIMRNSNGRDYWGKSMWDEQVADANDFYNNLSDLRGQNQPWYAQLGAGLLKGVTTFGTTFLDGTIGLLYGVGSAIRNGDNKTGWDRAAQIFHNDVSNALQDFNEFMEEFAPNYKSRDEENNKWYQNLGTMNFWADGLIKNLGFTVGAFYSGGVFTKAIKGVGGLIAAGKAGKAAKAYKAAKVKELMEAGMTAEEAAKAVSPMATAAKYTNTLKAIEGARSGTGIAVAGSLFSAVNEGRIEANQVYRDAFTLGNTPEESKGAAAEILAARNRKMQEIEDDPTLLPSEKQALQAQVQANSQKLLAEAEQNAAKAGMLTLGLNIPILTIDNFKMYGRLYSRGFKQSVKQVGNNVTTQELKAAQEAVKNATTKQEKEAAKRALREAERKAKAAHNARNNARVDDVAENVTEKEGRFAWNEITKGQAAWRGIKQGLMEGNEEMMQAWASGTAGNMTMPEDPDAYYKALTDPNATVKTNDFLTSVTKGFLDSYGNMDRWEEGAIGFLTGILGMPTFGARANSDSNTYLGRGKIIGLSGGFFGEFSNANYLNRLGAESVKNLNAFRDKYKQHAQFLAQSQAFTDAMDGYLQDKNKFAYNNARDNDDFAMIQALAVTGRIDEVKAMLNFKEEDLTDDILDSIAMDFTANSNLVDSDGNPKTVDDSGKPLQGAWRDKAGNLMSRTEEGKAEMKAKLSEKQKRLNEEIDDYVASLDSVRAQVNNSLDESQVRELAWIDWKNKQWSRRFQDMQGEQAKAFELLISKATDEMKDLKPESDAYKALNNFKELIEKAQKAKSPIELLSALAKNNAFLDAMSKKVGKVAVEQEGGIYQIADEFLGDLITSDEEGLNAVETVGKALGDIRLMAIAQKQFKEKLDEYTSNPAKLAANRQKIENERQQQRNVTDTINETSELSSKKLRDFLDMDDDAFDTAAQNPILAEMEDIDLSTEENKAAFEEAKKIRKKRQDLLNKINSSDKLNAEQKKNAVALIQAAYNNATSLDNFTDLSNEAYTDPNNVPIPDNGNMTSDEIEAYQRDVSDSMQQVLGGIMNEDDSALDLPSTEVAKEAAENGVEAEFNFNDEHNTTGNSRVATPSESENERVERENKEKAKKEADKKRKDELNNFIKGLTEVFGPKDKRDRAKTYLWDIANGFISSYLKEGEFPKAGAAINGAKASSAFNGLKSLCENDSQVGWVDNRIVEKLYFKVRQLYDPVAIAQAEKEEQERAKKEQKRQDKERENPATVVLIESTADDISNKISNKVDKEQKDRQREHQYWKHTTTEYGIGEKAYEKGNYTKFSDRAQSMDYSPELKKKIAAVAKYFEDNGVWDRINSGDNGKIAAGRKVGFKIDPKLNEDAGEVIILLTDEDGNVIGDLDSHATNQANLSKFVEYVKKQFEKFSENNKGEFVLTQPNSNRPLVTKITQCMVGKVPYGDEYITLNEANDTNIGDDNENHKYYLGIAVADADGNVRVKATAQKVGSLGYIDRQIKQPIIEKDNGIAAGIPYLLVKSEGSNSYMCVPIITPTFDSEHYDEIMNSAYGSVIRKYIGDIENIAKNQGSTYKNLTQEQKPFIIKEILNDLFVGKFYIEYNKNNNTYTFKVNNSDFYANVSFEDEVPEGTNKFSIEDLLQSISGHSLGLQISRKYINGNNRRYNEKGQQINFNKTIGSIARVNIMPISRLQKQDGQHTSYLHTVDDWFTLNPLLVSVDDSGKVTIKAQEVEAPVSVGSNIAPKAVTNMTLTTTVKDEKTGENKETTVKVSVDYEGKSVTINERKIPVDSKNANKNLLKIARTAYAIEKARREGATKTVETSWGTFDLETNTFVNDTSVNTISDAGLDDDLFNMIAANNTQKQAESTPTTTTQTTTEQQTNTKNREKSYAEKSGFVFEPVSDYKKEYSCIQVFPDGKTVDTLQFRSEVEAKRVALTMLTMFKSAKDYQDLHDKVRSKGWSMSASEWTATYGYWEAFKDGRISEQDVLDLFTPLSYSQVTAPTTQTAETKGEVKEQKPEDLLPSTEITQEEREKIIKDNQVELPKSKYPSNGKNIEGYLAQISDSDGGSWGRVADRDDGSSSYYRMFDVNGDIAKFEFYAPEREQNAMAKWSSVLDTVADYEGDTDTADAVFTVEPGEVRRNSNGRWVVTKKAKLQLVKQTDIINNIFTDSDAVKRDLSILQRKKNEERERWENRRREEERLKQEQAASQAETVQEPTPQEIKQETEQNPVENPVQLPTAQEALEARPEEIEKAAKELYTEICGKNGEKIYDALTPEQRNAIANSDSQEAILERLRDEFKKGKFKKDVDSIITEYDTKYSRVNEEGREVWDGEKELAWLKKALPQLSNEQRVQIVDGLIKIKNSDNPGYAWGQFCRGLITISSEAASGTLYHEAFHAVIDLLMTEDEYNKLFDAAYQVYGNLGMLGLEEKLAEEFRKFVQYGDNAAFVDYDAEDIKTPIIRGIVRLFRRLKALIQGLSNKQIYLNKLFYDINKGKFADRKVQEGRNLQPKFDINERELEDIKKKAIADGTFMKAPNGKPTNLNERQWLQVRTKAFKGWFGDWETLAEFTTLEDKFKLEEVSRSEDSDQDDLSTRYKVFYDGKEIGFVALNQGDKTKFVSIAGIGLNKEFRHKGIGKQLYKYLAYQSYKQGKKFFSDNDEIHSFTHDARNVWQSFVNKGLAHYDRNHYVFDLPNASKAVDENGEPLVVYHTTDAEFTEFDKNLIGSKTDSGYYGTGFYFSPYKETNYGPNRMEVFLNIKNPRRLKGSDNNTGITLDNFDGAIVRVGEDAFTLDGSAFDPNEITELVVTEPNQIKSATDNVGTFSRENDDIRYSRVKTELDNKVAEFADAINKSIAETMTLNRYAQNWDYTKNIPLRKPDASDSDGRKAYFGIKNPMHFYKGQWTISNGAAKYGGKNYHEVVKNEVFKRLARVGMLDKFNALFDVTWNDATNHYVISLKAPEKIATLSEIVDFDSIPDDVLADMIVEEEKQAKEYSKNREKEILDSATKHTTTLFEGKTKIGLGKLFENMINAGVNRNKVALYRNILDRLGELKNLEVEISDNKDSRFSGGKVAGWYFSSSNSIALLNSLEDSFLEDTIVHETLHAVVANTVKDKEKLDKVVTIVEGIKKAVLEEYGVKSIEDIQDSRIKRLFYGLTNADEFISEFFSNSEFHDYVKNKQATWYNKFIAFIKSIIGTDVDITKAVKDLLSDFNGQIQEVRQTISMQGQLGTIFKDIADLSRQAVRPQESTEKQEPSIKQHHIQNLMYENLSEEDKEYIKEKGLSKEEYDDFSMAEKENLWYCR